MDSCIHGRKLGPVCSDCEELAALRQQVETLQEDLEEARKFGEKAAQAVNERSATRVIRCAFCDFEYPADTPGTQNELLTAHVKECKEHPLRIKIEYARLHASGDCGCHNLDDCADIVLDTLGPENVGEEHG